MGSCHNPKPVITINSFRHRSFDDGWTDQLQVYTTEFDGYLVVAISFSGRWCCVTAQVGRATGYARKDRFSNNFADEWDEAAVKGKSFEFLRYLDPCDFGKQGREHTVSVCFRPIGFTCPCEVGLHRALLRRCKPKGRYLRRLLIYEVLP